jgi:CHASE2 domain-containing sensor protein
MLSLVALLALHFLYFRGSSVGEHLEQAGYAVLRRVMSNSAKDAPQVVVVDTSNVRSVPTAFLSSDPKSAPVMPTDRPADEGRMVTDRAPLKEFLSQVVGMKTPPRAVGIDINFHNDRGRFLRPDDYQFFEFCLSLNGNAAGAAGAEKAGLPVFLGVYNVEGLPPEQWLAMPDYKKLAASMAVMRKDTGHLVAAITEPFDRYPPFLGPALAGFEDGKSIVERPKPIWPLELLSDDELHGKNGALQVKGFLVDYSWLGAIRRQTTHLDDYKSAADLERLQGKTVLLGDVERATIKDAFVVPGEPEPVPGVYLHACAAATLLQSPLYELRPAVRLTLDLVLALGVLCWLTWLRLRAPRMGKTVAETSLPPAFGLVAIAVIFTGLLLARWRVFWPDLLIASVLLAIHPLVEWARHTLVHALSRVRSA